jgi:MazG family protein
MTKSVPRPLAPPPPTGDARLDAVATLLAIVDRLRAPDGCPWDNEQTLTSLAPSLVEEAHEAVEAIDAGDDAHTAKELGDLLMVIALLAKIGEQEGGRFDLAAVARAVAAKLVNRHPHVFGDETADSASHVLANWERIKEAERAAAKEDTSALAGVPTALPALQRCQRVAAKAIAAGFRWSDVAGALAKVREECGELVEVFEGARDDATRLEEELGDLLLAGAFFGQYAGLDPERATRAALRRFEARFRSMEGEFPDGMRDRPLDELMAAWRRAKQRTASAP